MRWVWGIVVWVCLGGTAAAQVSPLLSQLTPEGESDILNRVRAHFYPETLPSGSPYRLDHATCGTPALMGLASNWNRLPVATKQTYAVLFQRPTLTSEKTVLTSQKHFLIHYTLSGLNAVDATDDDKNGVPDYVDNAARIFESVWDKEVNQMGYNPPPSDGDNIYDIYIKNLAPQNAYGFTYPINYPENVTPSYMEIDNNFADNIYYSRGLEGLEVTAAHEFFHAIQFGYYADFGASWWQELTAVWMEDVNYTDVNDYYQYLSCNSSYSCFFDTPEASLDKFSGSLHPFGGAVYAYHMAQVYGDASVRRVWETLRQEDPSAYALSEVDAGMPSGGFARVLPRFAAWNYLTGTRARSGYYAEAAHYPLVKHPNVTLTSGGPFSGSQKVDYLGATYLPVTTSGVSGGLRAVFTLGSGGDWTLMAMLISDGGVELLWPKSTTVVIPNVSRYREVVFIPMVTSLRGTQVTVSYTFSSGLGNGTPTDLVGDFTGDTAVNFSDFIAFAAGFGRSETDPDYNTRLDLNGDGPVDFNDFLLFVSHFGESK